MRRLLLLISVGLLVALPATAARAAWIALPPTADVGLPHWCDWGYDWDERCYTDDGTRLPIGGVDDKVWRSALRFSLADIPRDAMIVAAQLYLFHDGTCVAPRRTAGPCPARPYEIDAHRILTARWFSEREPEIDLGVAATARLHSAQTVGWLPWNLTSLVRAWHSGAHPNNGVLLKLAQGEEDFETSGPYPPSSSYAYASIRPWLVVSFLSQSAA
ncbi:MAG: DNRLRE domain-containing protein [Actinobacteria bacterium]|nr:DNRLRE domain-containing protein [Actinomycetota bacterium]